MHTTHAHTHTHTGITNQQAALQQRGSPVQGESKKVSRHARTGGEKLQNNIALLSPISYYGSIRLLPRVSDEDMSLYLRQLSAVSTTHTQYVCDFEMLQALTCMQIYCSSHLTLPSLA